MAAAEPYSTDGLLEKVRRLSQDPIWNLQAVAALRKTGHVQRKLVFGLSSEEMVAHIDRLILLHSLPDQGGVAATADADELEKACVQAIQRAIEPEAVSVSHMGRTAWESIFYGCGYTMEAMSLPDSTASLHGMFEPFKWSSEDRRLQSSRYMPYLKRHIALPNCTSGALVWLGGGDTCKDLLTVTGRPRTVHYRHISAGADAAVVTRAAVDCSLPQTGLCVVFEIRKRCYKNAMYKALCKLLLANIHSPGCQPVVVLTNLRNDWRLLWMDGNAIRAGRWKSRAAAAAGIQSLVGAAEARATAPAGSAAATAGPTAASPITVAGLVAQMPVRVEAPPGVRLAERGGEGMLPDGQPQDAQAAGGGLLRRVLQLLTFT